MFNNHKKLEKTLNLWLIYQNEVYFQMRNRNVSVKIYGRYRM